MASYNQNELYHYGIRGMKWGVRRYQNSDGSLTSEGKKRYGYGSENRMKRDLNRLDKERGYLQGDINRSQYFKDTYKAGSKKANADKYSKWDSKQKNAIANKKHIEASINAILKNAKDQGITLRSKDVIRDVERGRTVFARASMSAIMAASMAMVAPVGIGVSFYDGHRHYTSNGYMDGFKGRKYE